MEIIDYLQIAKRRWWILVVVPVLAVAATAAVALLGSATYTSTATVSSQSLVGIDGSPFSGTQSGPQFVSAFQAAAANPKTQSAVAAATGVGPVAQTDGSTITAIGSSSDLTVTFVGTDQKAVAAVPAELARQAISTLFSARADSATASRASAESAAKAANDAIAALSQKYGIADPPRAYQAALNSVASLQQQQAGLRSSGNAIGAAALDGSIAQANSTLAGYVPILAQYNNLNSVLTAANSDLTMAQAEYRHALALKSAGSADGVVDAGSSMAVNKVTSSLPTFAAVFGAGLFLAVVLVFLLEVVQRLRSAARAPRPDTDDAAGAAVREPSSPALESTEAYGVPSSPYPASTAARSGEARRAATTDAYDGPHGTLGHDGQEDGDLALSSPRQNG